MATRRPLCPGTMSLTPSLDALERAYDAAKYGGVSREPHVEITAPTTRWPSLAPAGKHVLLARAQYAPYELRDGAVWDDARSCELGEAVTTHDRPRRCRASRMRACIGTMSHAA